MKFNKKKILIALGMIGSVAIANAQWAVTNVNDALYFGPTGLFTQAMAKMNMAVNANIQAQTGTQQVMIQQQNHNMAVQDERMRRSMGLSEIAKRDNIDRPTLEMCAEVSKTAYTGASIGSMYSGGRRPGNKAPPGAPPTMPEKELQIVNSASAQALMLKDMTKLGTCSPEYGKVAGCSGAGLYAKADTSPLSLKTNMKGAAGNRDFANWSLDAQGYEVGKKYISDATLSNAPRFPSAEQLEKNPGYLAIYNSVITKLHAAQESMMDIINIRVGASLSGFAAELWAKDSGSYESLFGQKAPANPSTFEVVNLAVYRDFFLPEQKTDLVKEQNRLTAMSNYISWQQFKTQENTNILLAHLLVQTTTPTNKAQVDAEYNRIANLK